MRKASEEMLGIDNALLVVVDVQVKLVRAIYQRESLVENAVKLIRGMQVLDVPILYTEQNPDGLGPTVSPLAELLEGEAIVKTSFSCCGEKCFSEAVNATKRKQILLVGIETHVCIYQTAVDLIGAGYTVQVVSDAVSSRTPENKQIGLEKMKDAGAGLTSVEMVLFELLKEADGPRFKEILGIVK